MLNKQFRVSGSDWEPGNTLYDSDIEIYMVNEVHDPDTIGGDGWFGIDSSNNPLIIENVIAGDTYDINFSPSRAYPGNNYNLVFIDSNDHLEYRGTFRVREQLTALVIEEPDENDDLYLGETVYIQWDVESQLVPTDRTFDAHWDFAGTKFLMDQQMSGNNLANQFKAYLYAYQPYEVDLSALAEQGNMFRSCGGTYGITGMYYGSGDPYVWLDGVPDCQSYSIGEATFTSDT